MQVKCVVVGYLQENCYIVTVGDKSIIIDPGDEADKIISECEGLNVVEALITHNHFDHIGALNEIEKKFGIKANTKTNHFNYEIIKTPGHTDDSISFYFPNEKVLFSGDFLFLGTIGRTDLPTGNIDDMKKSLELISKYDDDIIVYPGHGNNTILGYEKKRFNRYF